MINDQYDRKMYDLISGISGLVSSNLSQGEGGEAQK